MISMNDGDDNYGDDNFWWWRRTLNASEAAYVLYIYFFTMLGTSTSKDVKRRRGNMEKVEEKDQEKSKNITTLHTLKSSKAMQ